MIGLTKEGKFGMKREFIRVLLALATAGVFGVAVAAPTNDYFDDAEEIYGESGSVTGSNVDATFEEFESILEIDNGRGSIWYEWVAPADGKYLFKTVGSTDSGGSVLDTVLAVCQYNYWFFEPYLVDINDDNRQFELSARLYVDAVEGETYYFSVSSYSTTGNVKLSWARLPTYNVGGPNASDSYGDGSESYPFASIQTAVDKLYDIGGGTVVAKAGVYGPVTIAGGGCYDIIAQDGPLKTTINGNYDSCCFYVEPDDYEMYSEEVNLIGFTLTWGLADDGGGAFGGCLYRCILKDNVAAFRGGGSYRSILDNCLVIDNRADGSLTDDYDGASAGGGAFASFLYNCTVVGNSASSSTGDRAFGGGTYSYSQIGDDEEEPEYRERSEDSEWLEMIESFDDYEISEGGSTSALGGVYNSIVYDNKADMSVEDCFWSMNDANHIEYEAFGSLIGVDPKFANGYHLGEGSPAVDAGEDLETHRDLDLDGNRRHLGKSVDCGCYESAGTLYYVDGLSPWYSAVVQTAWAWTSDVGASWELCSWPDWMEPAEVLGTGWDDMQFELEANATGAMRKGTVVVNCEDEMFELTVNQAAEATAGNKVYGFFVGVEEYKDDYASYCSGCETDAERMYDAFISLGNCTEATAKMLCTEEASKTAIRSKLAELAGKAVSGDVVIYTHSSHGGVVREPNGTPTTRTSILCYDEEYEDAELAEDLDKFKAGVRVIVILDTCHSAGMFDRRGAGARQKESVPRVSASAFAARVQSLLKARKSTRKTDRRDEYAGGAQVGFLAAANYYRYSLGNSDGGAFTSALLEGWENGGADDEGDNDDQTNFYELFCYAARRATGNFEFRNHFDETDPQCFNEAVLLSTLADKSESADDDVNPLTVTFDGTQVTFERAGDELWEIDEENPVVLRSGTPPDNGTSMLGLPIRVSQPSAKLSFEYMTSTEANGDELFVFAYDANEDLVAASYVSGLGVDWEPGEITFDNEGEYYIVWAYVKNESGSAGDDCVYLKGLRFEGCEPVGTEPVPPPVQQAAKPVLSSSGTTFADSLTVTCSCDTDGATIRYTTDGSPVTASSPIWRGDLQLTVTTTVKVKAFKDGMDPSVEVSQTYTKEEPKVAVSKFTMNGHQAVVCGVIGATADSFKSTDNCGNPCLIDIRIIDAEKSAEWVDDNYWCTALSQMDMLVWLGWAKDIGCEDEDALANYFRKNPSLLRTKPSDISGWPSEGQYGYNGVFDWFADQTGGQTLDVQSGSIGSSFLQVLQNSLQGGDALVRMDVVSDCTSNPWLSHGGEISHSVICCGYALDPAVSSTSPSALVGLFLIDSDNDQYAGAGGTSAPNSISYVSARWNGSRYDFTNVWGGRDGYADWSCVYDVLHAKPGYTPVGVKVGNDPTPPPSVDRVATPVLDPPSNMTFKTSLAVKCTCPTEGATIRFATNETDVITESFPVWADLTLTATTVIRVKAFKANMQASDEVKCVYTLDPEGGEQGNSSLWTDSVIDVGKKDRTEATAATTYTGWLHDSKGNLTASFTMKVGKANKNGIAKVTLTVTDLATGIKSKYTGNYNVEEGEIEGGQLDGLALGEDGVVGKIGKETLTGGRMANKTEAAAVDAVYKNRIFAFAFQNTAGKNVKGAATFTAKFSSKGKAKISGTLMDGTKVSTSAQLIVGDKACALPISFTKKGKANFGLVLWFNEKKATFKEATGLTECTLGDGVTDVKVEFVGCDEVDGTMAKAKALEVDGKKVADIAANGTKWVATAAKDFEDAKPKVTYAAKKGTITGTYKATVKGAAKPVSAKITGVWLGKTGVGTAVMKVNKVVTALPVVVK